MRTPQELERGLVAPETLGLNSRVEIREAAKHLLAELPTGTGRLVIDLSATRTIDSAGLGAAWPPSAGRPWCSARRARRSDSSSCSPSWPISSTSTMRPERALRLL